MKHIGIDVSKKTLQVAFDEHNNKSFINDTKGFNAILKNLEPNSILALEPTANYHHKFAVFFLQRDFTVKEINPIITSKKHRGEIRKTKTDFIDAEIIRQCSLSSYGRTMSLNHIKSDTAKLRYLTRYRQYLVKIKKCFLIKRKMFKTDVFDKKLIEKTNNQINNFFERKIKKIEEEIFKFDNEYIQILKSVTGIGPILAAIIFSEIGDISKFSGGKQIVAFAGLDPKIRQSGTSINGGGKLSKRGSPYLRSAFFMAASSNICSTGVFKDYYEKMKNKGKSYTQATCCVARKMTKIIYSLLKNKTFFEKDNYLKYKTEKK